jgi:hypothetical protein
MLGCGTPGSAPGRKALFWFASFLVAGSLLLVPAAGQSPLSESLPNRLSHDQRTQPPKVRSVLVSPVTASQDAAKPDFGYELEWPEPDSQHSLWGNLLLENRRTWLGLSYTDPDAPGRHIGWGEPLVGTSWLNRPLHLGWAVGTVIGDDLISGKEGQESDVWGAYRIGWDADHYWGAEYRLAFARPDLQDAEAVAQPRIARHWYSDFHLLHYPWGDSRWRPFWSVGIGWASFEFTDAESVRHRETLLHLPIGGGLKYYVGNWMALRLDATDNLAISGSELDTMHNVTIAFGVEAHFGPGTHRKYGY